MFNPSFRHKWVRDPSKLYQALVWYDNESEADLMRGHFNGGHIQDTTVHIGDTFTLDQWQGVITKQRLGDKSQTVNGWGFLRALVGQQ